MSAGQQTKLQWRCLFGNNKRFCPPCTVNRTVKPFKEKRFTLGCSLENWIAAEVYHWIQKLRFFFFLKDFPPLLFKCQGAQRLIRFKHDTSSSYRMIQFLSIKLVINLKHVIASVVWLCSFWMLTQRKCYKCLSDTSPIEPLKKLKESSLLVAV